MKRFLVILSIILFSGLFIACGSAPKKVQNDIPVLQEEAPKNQEQPVQDEVAAIPDNEPIALINDKPASINSEPKAITIAPVTPAKKPAAIEQPVKQAPQKPPVVTALKPTQEAIAKTQAPPVITQAIQEPPAPPEVVQPAITGKTETPTPIDNSSIITPEPDASENNTSSFFQKLLFGKALDSANLLLMILISVFFAQEFIVSAVRRKKAKKQYVNKSNMAEIKPVMQNDLKPITVQDIEKHSVDV
jgi:hypothetical protein